VSEDCAGVRVWSHRSDRWRGGNPGCAGDSDSPTHPHTHTPTHPLIVLRPGTLPYDEAVALQERLHAARRSGEVPDVLILLEHPPVVTLGRGAKVEHLLRDPAELERQGVQVRETARGGDVTYHGPGQLVGYPIFDLNVHGRDVHAYVRSLEEALIRVLAAFGVAGDRTRGQTGVWVGNEKVAAIGVGVRQWVTWHGFALNVSTDLGGFRHIVPCGIHDRGVTSLERLIGRSVPMEEVVERAIAAFGEVFELSPDSMELPEVLR
jgi:lipoate-protein ligase B